VNKKQFRALLTLNIVLLALLGAVSLASSTSAQQGAGRARGVYTMVAGQIQPLEESAIYIVDANNQEIIAMHWDQGQRKLAPLGHRSMSTDSQVKTGGRR
jgi:hypothetical protein